MRFLGHHDRDRTPGGGPGGLQRLVRLGLARKGNRGGTPDTCKAGGTRACPVWNLIWRLSAAAVGRPIWFANSGARGRAETTVLTAHRQASGLSHRLLLILAPADPKTGHAFAAAHGRSELSRAAMGDAGYPDASTQVMIAD